MSSVCMTELGRTSTIRISGNESIEKYPLHMKAHVLKKTKLLTLHHAPHPRQFRTDDLIDRFLRDLDLSGQTGRFPIRMN